jgi:hypothetical protein
MLLRRLKKLDFLINNFRRIELQKRLRKIKKRLQELDN